MKDVCRTCKYAKDKGHNSCYCVKYGIIIGYSKTHCVSHEFAKEDQEGEKDEDQQGTLPV